MTSIKSIFFLAAIILIIPATLNAAEPVLGLTVSAGGSLLHAGKSFCGIGVDYYGCFYRLVKDPTQDQVIEAGFKVLEAHHIPFVRFAAMPYWPNEFKLYQTDPEEYWRRLDKIVHDGEQHDVGLIPCLAWNDSTIPDLVGEAADAWGNPGSKTRAFMRDFTRQLIARYKDSPAIWGWEFGNEFNLRSDLPNAAEHRPVIQTTLGTPTTRTAHDDLTSDMSHDAFIDFAKEVRKLDPNRIIESGNSVPRVSAWHQRAEKSWTKDSPAQLAEALAGDCPDPMDVVSVHIYEPEDIARLPELMAITGRLKKPLFVGEFGVQGTRKETEERFNALLKTIVDLHVPIAAVWVFDFPGMPEWSMSGDDDRSYQLRAIEAANAEIQRRGGQ